MRDAVKVNMKIGAGYSRTARARLARTISGAFAIRAPASIVGLTKGM
jgi:hypothetical protein